MELYLATDDGLVIGQRQGDGWREAGRTLAGREVTSVIAREGVILAGTTGGVFRSDDGGQTWDEASNGLAVRHVRWLAYHPEMSDLEFAGTEPAAIFVSQDGAESWQERSEVARLRDQLRWFLPYSPEAGCVRGFAFHGRRLYAAVEVGGLLRSDDQGASWRLAEGSDGVPRWGTPAAGFIHPDVHSVAVHPSSPELIYAPTGGGFYLSADGGQSWTLRYDCYCRAVWADPADPDHLILGPAESVEEEGRIEESHDGGRHWQPLTAGLDTPWPGHMVERFTPVGDHLLAVLSNGDLLAAVIGEWQWQRIFPDVAGVRCVATMAG
ncbi:MAG: hypothetical protein L0332_31040 [Chloroflexi bacterium]|nr:hypothetical protein [Chloroflexota bacterium]MCI0580635.1 hypothetical protein [Chloroflexota bacterium]MCI0647647.1 hypothetical protein [Chloroflexota bacterium]MCI0731137.1 hypothetical protein [Chloroflexota bacterium]